MLHVALAPASVPHQHITDRRRRLFISARQIGVEAHSPTSPAQQSSLDEIVTDHMAPERGLAFEHRQVGRSGKGLRANDGIVSPEVAANAVPCGQAVTE